MGIICFILGSREGGFITLIITFKDFNHNLHIVLSFQIQTILLIYVRVPVNANCHSQVSD